MLNGMPEDPGASLPRPQRIFRFGDFELRTETGELSKRGIRVKAQAKPLQILEALLEKPGQLITREELCRKLWPSGTFVDFENGLNTATNRLRAALNDSAETPRYVETLPRRGYRFICPVTEVVADRPVGPVADPEAQHKNQDRAKTAVETSSAPRVPDSGVPRRRAISRKLGIAIALLAFAALVFAYVRSAPRLSAASQAGNNTRPAVKLGRKVHSNFRSRT